MLVVTGASFLSFPVLPDVSCLKGAGAQPDWVPEAKSVVTLLHIYWVALN